jgi:hypothetical protein
MVKTYMVYGHYTMIGSRDSGHYYGSRSMVVIPSPLWVDNPTSVRGTDHTCN